MAMAAEAVRPTLQTKQDWLNKAITDHAMSFSRKRMILSQFLPTRQDAFRDDLAEQYFTLLPRMAKNSGEEFLNLFAWSVIPATCSEKSSKDLASFIASNGKMLPPKVSKTLRIGEQEDLRCVAIRAEASQGSKAVEAEVW